jgi:hypothetical protein
LLQDALATEGEETVPAFAHSRKSRRRGG